MQEVSKGSWPKHLTDRIGHRAMVLVTGCFVLAYAVAVLLYSWSVPEVGIDTDFHVAVSGLDPEFIRNLTRADAHGLTGWTVAQVGDETIDSWPQWIRVIRGLD